MSAPSSDLSPKPPPPKENFSFQALQEELGSPPSASKLGTPKPDAPPMAGPAPQAFRTGQRSAPPIGADELSKRVLRGSAPRSKPMWVKGLWPGAVSLALCIFVYVNDDVKTIQPYFSYGVMVIGGFTMIWGADGLRRSDWEPKERYLCGVPFAMGLVALILAFFLRGV